MKPRSLLSHNTNKGEGAMGHELGTENMTADLAREKELEMVNFFRNIMVSGALLAFAKFVAKDKRVMR